MGEKMAEHTKPSSAINESTEIMYIKNTMINEIRTPANVAVNSIEVNTFDQDIEL
jgi:hypothetical protein